MLVTLEKSCSKPAGSQDKCSFKIAETFYKFWLVPQVWDTPHCFSSICFCRYSPLPTCFSFFPIPYNSFCTLSILVLSKPSSPSPPQAPTKLAGAEPIHRNVHISVSGSYWTGLQWAAVSHLFTCNLHSTVSRILNKVLASAFLVGWVSANCSWILRLTKRLHILLAGLANLYHSLPQQNLSSS